MAFYPDLDPCSYFDSAAFRPSSFLLAVGWLEREHPFGTGNFDGELYAALSELAKRPWEPVMCLGYHSCTLCDRSDGLEKTRMGGRNLFIPGNGVIYIAPELILHYMKHHLYRPPEEFRQAVVCCPPMSSRAYFKKLKENRGDARIHWKDRPFPPTTFWRKIKTRLKRHLPPL